MANVCRAELCPMWDGDTCPCNTFGLDPNNPPTSGTFTLETEHAMSNQITTGASLGRAMTESEFNAGNYYSDGGRSLMNPEIQHPQATKARPSAWDGHPITWAAWELRTPPRINEYKPVIAWAAWELREAGHLCTDTVGAELHTCASCGHLHDRVLICRGHCPAADQGLTLIRCTGCGADVAVKDFGPVWELDTADYDQEGPRS